MTGQICLPGNRVMQLHLAHGSDLSGKIYVLGKNIAFLGYGQLDYQS